MGLEKNCKLVFQFQTLIDIQYCLFMHILGNILEYLYRIYLILETFSGKDAVINRYDGITNNITGKKYDFLNQRNLAFDKDYEEFKNQIEDLHIALISVINQYFHRSKGVIAGLQMQKKIEKISIPELDHFARYVELFKALKWELSVIKKMFIENQENPPLDRNMPYFAGIEM